MDAAIGAKVSPEWEGKMYTDELLRDDSVVAKMRAKSVFIYNTSKPQGTYFLAPKVSSDYKANRIKIVPLDGAIVFVKISLSSTPVTSFSQVIDYADFEKCYNAAAWLRSRLGDAGYGSLSELTQGFTVLPPGSVEEVKESSHYIKPKRTTTDTLFFDEHDFSVIRSYARSYSITVKDTGSLYKVTDRYLSNGNIKMTGQYANIDSGIKDGSFTYYHESGKLSSHGTFRRNKMNGLWEDFYDTLNAPLWYSRTYKDGYEDGELKSYYVDGKLKRQEIHKRIVDTVYYKEHKQQKSRTVEVDSIVSGHCYDRDGKEIMFTRFKIMPKAAYDLNKFLFTNIHYPDSARENDQEGRVVIRFIVDKSGNINDASVVKGVSEDIDNEALRVVNIMPPWMSGMRDDQKVDMVFYLPIAFKLE